MTTPSGPATDLNSLVALARHEHRSGRLAEAATAYWQILAIRPDVAEAHNGLGTVLAQQGRLDEAAAQFHQALALRPDLAEPHYNLGRVLAMQNQLDQAAARFEQALALRPDYTAAHNGLGQVRWRQGRLDDAAAHLQQALALRPDDAEAHNSLGGLLARMGQFDQAAQRFQQALALRPNFAEAHNNLGSIFWNQGQLDQAAARFEQAIALQPDLADAHYNLGVVFKDQGQLDQTLAAFERALALRPGYAEAQLGLATCHLAAGDFERGWPAYEARLGMPGFVRRGNIPRWSGESLTGRSLLLVGEQCLGDTLQFVRYARLLKARGARVLLAAQPPLCRLLASHSDLDEVCPLGSPTELPAADFYLPLLSLPGVLGTNLATIPAEVPYLWADPGLVERWRQELAPVEGFKIGIAWRAAHEPHAYHWRSVPLADFAPLAGLPGVQLISLQKGFGSEQIAAAGFSMLDFAGRLDEEAGPFMDTAAVIGSLDLVVSIDTSIAHLAGALGAPVFLALPLHSEWRWLRDRDDSPWYPTMRLFRQKSWGDWPEVIGRIAQAIQQRRQVC